MTTIDDIFEEEEDLGSLVPIACKFCESRYITYIEFDFVIHLSEHGIGRGYLDTPPTPYSSGKSWLADYRIRDAIREGKELGAELDDRSIERLDLEYSRYMDKTPSQVSIPTATYEGNFTKMPLPYSQIRKGSFIFKPIIPVNEFFENLDKPYLALRNHPLEQSACYPIIGVKPAGRFVMYYCEICQPEFANDSVVASIHLSSIEHHCRYRDPEKHEVEILSRLRQAHVILSQIGK